MWGEPAQIRDTRAGERRLGERSWGPGGGGLFPAVTWLGSGRRRLRPRLTGVDVMEEEGKLFSCSTGTVGGQRPAGALRRPAAKTGERGRGREMNLNPNSIYIYVCLQLGFLVQRAGPVFSEADFIA